VWNVWGRGEAYTGFWWEDLREKPLVRPRRRWEDKIKTDLQEMGCGGMDWIELVRALVDAVMTLRVP
jgi:hypothetical protein